MQKDSVDRGDTPRTDAKHEELCRTTTLPYIGMTDFARQLERENAEALALLEETFAQGIQFTVTGKYDVVQFDCGLRNAIGEFLERCRAAIAKANHG